MPYLNRIKIFFIRPFDLHWIVCPTFEVLMWPKTFGKLETNRKAELIDLKHDFGNDFTNRCQGNISITETKLFAQMAEIKRTCYLKSSRLSLVSELELFTWLISSVWIKSFLLLTIEVSGTNFTEWFGQKTLWNISLARAPNCFSYLIIMESNIGFAAAEKVKAGIASGFSTIYWSTQLITEHTFGCHGFRNKIFYIE